MTIIFTMVIFTIVTIRNHWYYKKYRNFLKKYFLWHLMNNTPIVIFQNFFGTNWKLFQKKITLNKGKSNFAQIQTSSVMVINIEELT